MSPWKALSPLATSHFVSLSPSLYSSLSLCVCVCVCVCVSYSLSLSLSLSLLSLYVLSRSFIVENGLHISDLSDSIQVFDWVRSIVDLRLADIYKAIKALPCQQSSSLSSNTGTRQGPFSHQATKPRQNTFKCKLNSQGYHIDKKHSCLYTESTNVTLRNPSTLVNPLFLLVSEH